MHKQNAQGFSAQQKTDSMNIADLDVTKDQIAEWLKRDIQGAVQTIHELLANPIAIGALVDVYYERYQRLRKQDQIKESLDELKHHNHGSSATNG